MRAQSQTPPAYDAGSDDQIIGHAFAILARRVCKGEQFTRPEDVGRFFVLRSHNLTKEVFSAAWLDAQHRVLGVEDLSTGTLTQASVYPREVVKSALAHNAAAVIFSHNHPSGLAEPSQADEQLTRTLKTALALVDVKTLDHIITGGADYVSLAERGIL